MNNASAFVKCGSYVEKLIGYGGITDITWWARVYDDSNNDPVNCDRRGISVVLGSKDVFIFVDISTV